MRLYERETARRARAHTHVHTRTLTELHVYMQVTKVISRGSRAFAILDTDKYLPLTGTRDCLRPEGLELHVGQWLSVQARLNTNSSNNPWTCTRVFCQVSGPPDNSQQPFPSHPGVEHDMQQGYPGRKRGPEHMMHPDGVNAEGGWQQEAGAYAMQQQQQQQRQVPRHNNGPATASASADATLTGGAGPAAGGAGAVEGGGSFWVDCSETQVNSARQSDGHGGVAGQTVSNEGSWARQPQPPHMPAHTEVHPQHWQPHSHAQHHTGGNQKQAGGGQVGEAAAAGTAGAVGYGDAVQEGSYHMGAAQSGPRWKQQQQPQQANHPRHQQGQWEATGHARRGAGGSWPAELSLRNQVHSSDSGPSQQHAPHAAMHMRHPGVNAVESTQQQQQQQVYDKVCTDHMYARSRGGEAPRVRRASDFFAPRRCAPNVFLVLHTLMHAAAHMHRHTCTHTHTGALSKDIQQHSSSSSSRCAFVCVSARARMCA